MKGTNTVNKFLNGLCCPQFLTGTPTPGIPFPDSQGEAGGSPFASLPGLCAGACASAVLRSRPLSKDPGTTGPGRPQSLSGQRCRPKGTLLSPIGVQLPPPHPTVTPGTGASREAPASRRRLWGLLLVLPQPRGEHCAGKPSPGAAPSPPALGLGAQRPLK